MSKGFWLSGVAAAAFFASLASAQAGGFAIREQSAAGLGDAFAGAAAGGAGLSSMFWNPATMTNYAGVQTSTTLSGILPYSNITPTTGTSPFLLGAGGAGSTGDIAQDAIVPASYASWQIADRAWVGLAINTPYGLITKNPFNWAGQIYGRTSKVESYDANPTVAIQLNDWVSVGVGLQIMYFKVRLTQATGITANAPSAELKGDDTALGFTAGATFKPMAGTEIGIGYRSRVNPKLGGSLFNPAVPVSLDIASDLKLPDQVNVGVRQRITNDFTLLAGYEWTHWSAFSRFPVVTNSGATATTLFFDYRDSWFASIGGEYAWNNQITLRAGLGFEKSPITDQTRSVRLPDSNRTWATLGGSYQWSEKLTFDASYAHLFAQSGSVNIVPGNPTLVTTPFALPFVGATKSHVDIISVGLTYRWDDPRKIIPVEKPPLITKG